MKPLINQVPALAACSADAAQRRTSTATSGTRATRAVVAKASTVVAVCAGLAVTSTALASAHMCRAIAGQVHTVVELYTSEGCSSCPPADRWASTLKGRSEVLTLAFHVDYWDRLGWPDRFASKQATARQYQLAHAAGSRSVYTPQVVVNGQDWRRWPGLPKEAFAKPAATPSLELQREGERVTARWEASSVASSATSSAPSASGRQLGGYWAVLEDAHLTRVRAGENAGETLRHDHVVRLYQPVPDFSAGRAQSWQLLVSGGEPQHPRRVAFVVTNAVTLRPVQAVVLPLAPRLSDNPC